MAYKTKKKQVAVGRRSWVIKHIEDFDDKHEDAEFFVYTEKEKE